MNPAPVTKGLNTWIGYLTALALALAAAATAILNSIDQTSVPPWVIAVLVALAAIGERITGLSRVSQVNAATKALPRPASPLIAEALAPLIRTERDVPPLPKPDGEQ